MTRKPPQIPAPVSNSPDAFDLERARAQAEHPDLEHLWLDTPKPCLQGCSWSLAMLTHPTFVLPAYQRQLAWDTSRQADFLNYVLTGGILTPIYLLEVQIHTYLVIDGQQRLHTLGTLLQDIHGTARPPHPLRFDLKALRFAEAGPNSVQHPLAHYAGPGPRTEERELLTRFRRGDLSESEYAQWHLGHTVLRTLVQQISLPVITAGWANRQNTSPTFQRDLFRAINRQGVDLSEGEVEALIEAGQHLSVRHSG